MNMTLLFHQFRKRVIAPVKDNSEKAVACLKTIFNAFVRRLPKRDRPPQIRSAHIVFTQRFLVLQHLIARSNRAVLLHYRVYPH